MKKASNEEIITAYKETGSIWKMAQRLGMCGQSVHERLRALHYKMQCPRWSTDEIEQLRSMVGILPIGKIARQLGRPYGGVATKLSVLGLVYQTKSNRQYKIKRGKGFDRASVLKHTKEIDASECSIRSYCRNNKLFVEMFVKAVQKYYPQWWDAFVKTHSELPLAKCDYCQAAFYPLSKKQRACSRKCQSDLRADKAYFGGNRRSAVGMAEGICQLCRQPKTVLAAHHLFGKENDPENERLIALCNGCHHIVENLAARKFLDDKDILEDLICLALVKRNGASLRAEGGSIRVFLDIEREFQEEDALTGKAYLDDSQIVKQCHEKVYSNATGAWVIIRECR